MANTNVAYPVLGVYLLLVLGAGLLGAVLTFLSKTFHKDRVREHFLAGSGLGTFVWFWTMMATLFSGYSVSGIVNEAYGSGWMATRWIAGGVGLYIAFAILAPRLHALSKRRGYFTISQVIFDRYSCPSSSSPIVAHILHCLTFFCLQLPVFTYLITQFRSVGVEVRTFTLNEITATTAINVAAAVLLICDIFGGMRGVAYTDVVQGIVLFFGSITFLIIQRTELGGLDQAHDYWSDPKIASVPRVWAMQHVPKKVNIVAYFDFVFKTTAAATMFPHLTARLFAARKASVIRRGMAVMMFTFFVVQLSSMITGWTAISVLRGKNALKRGESAFGKLLQIVADRGSGQAFASALLLASAICAMMSTADSALLACSQMWVRDIYTKYVRPHASQTEQVVFGKFVSVIALAIGVLLGNLSAIHGKPDLSGLFAIQNVTPIHVVPAIWLGLHWRGLRGEAVLAGFLPGLAVTLGFCFSDRNVALKNGSDMTEMGLSSAWIGFVINMGITLIAGLLMQHCPQLFPWIKPLPPPPTEYEEIIEDETAAAALAAAAATDDVTGEAAAAVAKGVDAPDALSPSPSAINAESFITTPPVVFVHRWLDIGTHRDKILSPALWIVFLLILLFTVPFYRVPASWDGYVGAIGAWPFTSLFLSGILAIVGAYAFIFKWENYKPAKEDPIVVAEYELDANGAKAVAEGMEAGPAQA